MSNGNVCDEVKAHIRKHGGFNLQWLKQHSKTCSVCISTSSLVSECVDEMLGPLYRELEGDDE